MNYVVIEDVKPWDGRYELDIDGQELTTREWGFIKRLTGYLPATSQQGLEGADPELFCAIAVIALRRAGRIENQDVQQVYDRLADAPFGATIRLEGDELEEEADADPPSAGSSNGSSSTSAPASRTSSGRSAPTPPATGTPASATSASPLPRSGI